APAPATPITRPTRYAGPFTRPRGETSINTTAMIGIGLIATPTAAGSMLPTALPISSFRQLVECTLHGREGPKRVGFARAEPDEIANHSDVARKHELGI